MAIDVKAEIVVDKTPEEVAEVMFNPKRDKLWVRDLREVYPMESGLYSKGAKIERVGNFLNKHYSAKLLVTAYKENSFVQLYADEPFEMNIRYDLTPADEGTNVRLRISSIAEIPFNSPVSVVSGKAQEMIERDLETLKKHLEQN